LRKGISKIEDLGKGISKIKDLVAVGLPLIIIGIVAWWIWVNWEKIRPKSIEEMQDITYSSLLRDLERLQGYPATELQKQGLREAAGLAGAYGVTYYGYP